jgi:hypothetical protein
MTCGAETKNIPMASPLDRAAGTIRGLVGRAINVRQHHIGM